MLEQRPRAWKYWPRGEWEDWNREASAGENASRRAWFPGVAALPLLSRLYPLWLALPPSEPAPAQMVTQTQGASCGFHFSPTSSD
jgi:hypothetical protein